MKPTRSEDAIVGKRHKAARYMDEQGRFQILSVLATMESEHDNRILQFSDGSWKCSCDFFLEHCTCSHTMALEAILCDKAGLRLPKPPA
jgi:hypothetical protein